MPNDTFYYSFSFASKPDYTAEPPPPPSDSLRSYEVTFIWHVDEYGEMIEVLRRRFGMKEDATLLLLAINEAVNTQRRVEGGSNRDIIAP